MVRDECLECNAIGCGNCLFGAYGLMIAKKLVNEKRKQIEAGTIEIPSP